MNEKEVKRWALLFIFAFTAFTTIGSIIDLLCTPSNVTSGIATFHFNIDIPSPEIRSLTQRNGLGSVESAAASVAGAAQTAAPGIASQVQSAVGHAATAIPNAIEASIPSNCSLGTDQFCVGFVDRIVCDALPLTLSDIFPSTIFNTLHQNADLQPLQDNLSKISTPYIRNSLITGLILTSLSLILFAITLLSRSFFRLISRGSSRSNIGAYLAFGIICCIPYTIPVAIFQGFLSLNLPPEIAIDKGEARMTCISALIRSIVPLAILLSASPAIARSFHGEEDSITPQEEQQNLVASDQKKSYRDEKHQIGHILKPFRRQKHTSTQDRTHQQDSTRVADPISADNRPVIRNTFYDTESPKTRDSIVQGGYFRTRESAFPRYPQKTRDSFPSTDYRRMRESNLSDRYRFRE